MRHEHHPAPRALLAWALSAVVLSLAAAAQVAVFDGKLEATAGGFRFGDGTLQTTAFGGTDYAGILVVDGSGGGDFTTIQAALDAIGSTLPAASASNPYLVRVAPGVYGEQVTMKEWVDLEGAGEGATRIIWAGAGDDQAYTVSTADNAELRFLTVENTGGASLAWGVRVSSGDPTRSVYRVTVEVSGGTSASVGVKAYGGATALLRQVTVVATGSAASSARAFEIKESSPTLLDVDAFASGGVTNYAILILGPLGEGTPAAPTIRGGTARATGTVSGSGINVATAVSLNRSSTTILGLTMLASGGDNAIAFLVNDGNPPRPASRIHGSRLEASGATANTGALNSNTDQTLKILNSTIVVPAGNALSAGSDETIEVASSLVDGAIDVASGGTYTCVASFDGSFTAIGANCL